VQGRACCAAQNRVGIGNLHFGPARQLQIASAIGDGVTGQGRLAIHGGGQLQFVDAQRVFLHSGNGQGTGRVERAVG